MKGKERAAKIALYYDSDVACDIAMEGSLFSAKSVDAVRPRRAHRLRRWVGTRPGAAHGPPLVERRKDLLKAHANS